MASGTLNRYVFQPGITDVRAQVQAMAPWVTDNLGKRVTMIFPDYAFGYDHRDYFSAAVEARGGSVAAKIAIPPTESSFTRYFPQIPADTEVLYHVMVGPGVLTFVKEMGEHFGSKRPRIFGFIDSLEGVDIASPASRSWRAPTCGRRCRATPAAWTPWRTGTTGRRSASTRTARASTTEGRLHQLPHVRLLGDALRDQAGRGAERVPQPHPGGRRGAHRGDGGLPGLQRGIGHPQGYKEFNGALHQCYGRQFISEVRGGRLEVVHTTSIEDGRYEPEADYTQQSL